MVREALSTPAARKVVMRVDKIMGANARAIRFAVVVCHPLSGQGEVHLQISINWGNPLLCRPEIGTFEVLGRPVELQVVARRERLAEKVRAFLDRGEDRDAFDLAYFHGLGLRKDELVELSSLVAAKLAVDHLLDDDEDLLALFDHRVDEIEASWGTRGSLVVMKERPAWDQVKLGVLALRPYVPARKRPSQDS